MKKWMIVLVCMLSLFLFAIFTAAADINLFYYSTSKLAWTTPTEGGPVVGYYLNYGTASGVYTYKEDVGNVLTIQVNSLPNITLDTEWYAAVSAYNDVGEGSKSNEVVITLTDIPPVPTNLRISQ